MKASISSKEKAGATVVSDGFRERRGNPAYLEDLVTGLIEEVAERAEREQTAYGSNPASPFVRNRIVRKAASAALSKNPIFAVVMTTSGRLQTAAKRNSSMNFSGSFRCSMMSSIKIWSNRDTFTGNSCRSRFHRMKSILARPVEVSGMYWSMPVTWHPLAASSSGHITWPASDIQHVALGPRSFDCRRMRRGVAQLQIVILFRWEDIELAIEQEIHLMETRPQHRLERHPRRTSSRLRGRSLAVICRDRQFDYTELLHHQLDDDFRIEMEIVRVLFKRNLA